MNYIEQIQNNTPRILQLILILALITLYWIGYRSILKYVNKKYSKKIAGFTNTSLLCLIFLLSLFTIFATFSSSISLFLSGLSFLSAAIVFALQDFFASFFAWIYINTSDQYSIGDSILITSDTRVIYGTVLDVGVFRTTLLEKIGDGGLDTEMNTGRIITFPNRFVHKHSLSNYTKNHLLIQHKFTFTIEYNQDYKKTKEIVTNSVNEVYTMIEENEQEFLDPHLPDDVSYTPKVFTHLDSSGVTYTIWFACKLGMKRVVLEYYSTSILNALEKAGIKLAYDTHKIIK